MQVPFSPPSITDVEIAEVLDTLSSGWITTGPKTRVFEQAFCERVGAKAAVAVNSCTAALALALKLHEIGPGDEVITTTLTFTSTVNVIEHTGARPVLVDVCPDTLNIDPEQVERSITCRTKAVIAVHYAGHPADIPALQAICDSHGLKLIEDAAHALPAAIGGRTIGGTGNLTTFSFYATKNLATGEGGMLTGPPELLERARTLSLHGMSRNAWNRYGANGDWFYDVLEPGFKYNMSDLQAALGVAQLKRLDDLQARRAEIYNRYNNVFARVDGVQTPVLRLGCDHAHHLYVLRMQDHNDRDELVNRLREYSVSTSVHFIPVHIHKYYRDRYGYSQNDFPVAFDSYQRMVSLPLSPALTDDQVTYVADKVACVIAGARKAAA
ncbi:UDP-4-amino-4-deoxy-L-arabinose--oxoglutarate aminotransferase [Posidoniimonas corsicana]|uniref:UDP-4-amino-4-deoxy-L-arabinose--oxoglutarate aminotransferase n=1 Tax=Posidoniimonas corsicana TaxID=1938618 RepID=A0A5C5V852_9BACT|nr:DegT/DnrJ/EryC1/StrS aminotransferase family protein [Posidoniimonas corsicana]TWT34017.1 UDP-4-amino-4-deoxy-L-arabinose--oxoglutarate aminotransferase [Posidoniimonas corsicana]